MHYYKSNYCKTLLRLLPAVLMLSVSSCKKETDHTANIQEQFSIGITNLYPDSYDSLNNYLRDTLSISIPFNGEDSIFASHGDSILWTPYNSIAELNAVDAEAGKETFIQILFANDFTRYQPPNGILLSLGIVK